MHLNTLNTNFILQNFYEAPGLAWQEALKKSQVKLYLLIDIHMPLMAKIVLEEEYVTLFDDMQKLIGNT